MCRCPACEPHTHRECGPDCILTMERDCPTHLDNEDAKRIRRNLPPYDGYPFK